MSDRPAPRWIYVLTHPAWEGLGMVRIGCTGRNLRTRAAETTRVSGLLASCKIAFYSPVSDMAGAEQAVHRMLAPHCVRKRCELFKVDVATAQQVIRAVTGSQRPPGHTLLGFLSRPLAVKRAANLRCFRPRHADAWRHGRRRIPDSLRLLAGLVMIGALIALLDPSMWP